MKINKVGVYSVHFAYGI